MIAPLALTLALAFWTPAGGVNPCPDGVNILPVPEVNPYTGVSLAGADGWAVYGIGCEIHLAPEVETYPIPIQCGVIAHELGHSLHRFPDEDEHAPNIMNGFTSTRPIPGICYNAQPAQARSVVHKKPARHWCMWRCWRKRARVQARQHRATRLTFASR